MIIAQHRDFNVQSLITHLLIAIIHLLLQRSVAIRKDINCCCCALVCIVSVCLYVYTMHVCAVNQKNVHIYYLHVSVCMNGSLKSWCTNFNLSLLIEVEIPYWKPAQPKPYEFGWQHHSNNNIKYTSMWKNQAENIHQTQIKYKPLVKALQTRGYHSREKHDIFFYYVHM